MGVGCRQAVAILKARLAMRLIGNVRCLVAGRQENGLSACSGMATARSAAVGSMLLPETSSSRQRNRLSGWRCETAQALRNGRIGPAGGWPRPGSTKAAIHLNDLQTMTEQHSPRPLRQ